MTDVRPDLQDERGDVMDVVPTRNYPCVWAFVSRGHGAARGDRDSLNAIQGEYVHVTNELGWRTWAIFRAGRISDLEGLEEQMHGVRRVLERMEILISIKQRARRHVMRRMP